MLNKFLYFATVFIITLSAWCSDCFLNEALKNPELNSNPKFWEELSRISRKGKPSDGEVQSLINQYTSLGAKISEPTNVGSFQKSLSIFVHSKAEKEINSLPKNLKARVDEFLQLATKPGGMKELRENPGRWHLEKLKAGNNSHTVRLNDGYRVLFEHDSEGLRILRVNREQIHGI